MSRNPDHSWAEVELHRWQYGELPMRDRPDRPLHVPTAMRRMAKAIEQGDPSNFPTPFNVVAVLRYAADRIEATKGSE